MDEHLAETLEVLTILRQDALESVVACDIAIDRVLDEMNACGGTDASP